MNIEDNIYFKKELLNEFNVKTRVLGKSAEASARINISDNFHTGHLLNKFSVNFWRQKNNVGSVIYRIGFYIPSTGMYLHYGVGNGYKHTYSGTVRTSNNKTNNPRVPKDWFNPVVKRLIELEEQVVNDYGSGMVLNSVNLQLPDEKR